jgi:uncharacterized membrane protein
VCSPACGAALIRADAAVELIISKSVQTARAGVFAFYVLGGVFVACAILAAFMMPTPFLMVFLAIWGVVMIVVGFLYGRVSKRQIPPP